MNVTSKEIFFIFFLDYQIKELKEYKTHIHTRRNVFQN